MKPSEYKAALAVVGLTASTVQQLFQVDHMTCRRWASGEVSVPRSVELSLMLMASRGVNCAQAMILIGSEAAAPHLDAA
ncbi:hypothetical protein [Rhizobium grahamii]|uniref:HTH cro/C1-type domain-containing protein n=1 Tax=Rhizobium grahamii CCGE 502 TaxID=990285 RepID=S3H909_9HYPH|nr:hypothetical protein [Rhizobium grahamii]EPE95074.1 hypothetical protein RGCCGE502_27052 [Rhizobium grahamii CCGE 502]